MTFEQKFSKISKKLVKADTSVYSENFAIQITMDDKDCGGTFFVAYIDGAYRVEPYDYVDNNASINVMSDVLEKLIDKKIGVEDAVRDNTLTIYGNMNSVVALFNGFEKKTVKKPAAKKSPAKKVAEKKVEEKKPATKKVAEKKPSAKKPVEKKVEEKKVEEKSVVVKAAAPVSESVKEKAVSVKTETKKEEVKPAAKTSAKKTKK